MTLLLTGYSLCLHNSKSKLDHLTLIDTERVNSPWADCSAVAPGDIAGLLIPCRGNGCYIQLIVQCSVKKKSQTGGGENDKFR